MKILILVLVLVLAGGWCSGYRIHPENISYYTAFDSKHARSDVKLRSGGMVSGVIEEETDDALKLNMDGAITTFKREEVESVKTQAAPDMIAALKKNYEDNRERHPLLSHRKEDALTARWDYAVQEPTRIAEKMKKDNPGLSATDALNADMAANARARQASYKARQKAMEETQAR